MDGWGGRWGALVGGIDAMMDNDERLLAIHAIAVAQAERIEVLERALRDCLSTYRTDELEVIVTEERQEAWIAALRGDS